VYVDLAGNHLSGPLPAELGQNPALMGLQLSGNQFSGVVPAAIVNHPFYRLDLNYNQLTSPDPRWLSWRSTQTVPPTNVQALMASDVVTLTWTPIAYTSEWYEFTYFGEGGYYEISYATAPTGPFTVHGWTKGKGDNSYGITGLTPGAPYYFRLRTLSYAHTYYDDEPSGWDAFSHVYIQPNNLWSDYTPVVCVNCEGTPVSPRAFLPILLR
jgi:hypothetical protein